MQLEGVCLGRCDDDLSACAGVIPFQPGVVSVANGDENGLLVFWWHVSFMSEGGVKSTEVFVADFEGKHVLLLVVVSDCSDGSRVEPYI